MASPLPYLFQHNKKGERMKFILFLIFTVMSFNSFAEKSVFAKNSVLDVEELKEKEKYQVNKGKLVEEFIKLSKEKFNKDKTNKFKDALKKLGNDFPKQVQNDIKELHSGKTIFDVIKNNAFQLMLGRVENFTMQFSEAPSPSGDSDMAREPIDPRIDSGMIVDPTKATSK